MENAVLDSYAVLAFLFRESRPGTGGGCRRNQGFHKMALADCFAAALDRLKRSVNLYRESEIQGRCGRAENSLAFKYPGGHSADRPGKYWYQQPPSSVRPLPSGLNGLIDGLGANTRPLRRLTHTPRASSNFRAQSTVLSETRFGVMTIFPVS